MTTGRTNPGKERSRAPGPAPCIRGRMPRSATTARTAKESGYDIIPIGAVQAGCNGLLSDIGEAGRLDGPTITEAQTGEVAAARANGRPVGCGGDRDAARQPAATRRGALFLSTRADIALLSPAADARTGGIRKALSNG